jgi:predicted dehydrogenase
MCALKIGVLGAGHLGRIHVQQLRELPEWEIAGIHDTDRARAEAVAGEFDVPVAEDPIVLMNAVDAIDIVTPTITHHDLATRALKAGKHVFIEKPLVNTLAEADDLVALAGSTGRKVQVGHVERFNPAFQAARGHLSSPMFIETHRLAQFNPRGTDVSVVLDLMIHDIDIVLHVVGHPVRNVHASGVSVVSNNPDIANARIEFMNGCVANLTASRISLKNMRKSRFFQRDAYISVDMLTKQTEIVRMRTVEGEPDPFAITMELGAGKGVREISFDRPEVPQINAIREELRAFAKAIMDGSAPVVTIEDGSAALHIAHRILERMGEQHERVTY